MAKVVSDGCDELMIPLQQADIGVGMYLYTRFQKSFRHGTKLRINR